MDSPVALLEKWISRELTGLAKKWFNSYLVEFNGKDKNEDFQITFGLIPRKLGKGDLRFNSAELELAGHQSAGWDPRFWSIDNDGDSPTTSITSVGFINLN